MRAMNEGSHLWEDLCEGPRMGGCMRDHVGQVIEAVIRAFIRFTDHTI